MHLAQNKNKACQRPKSTMDSLGKPPKRKVRLLKYLNHLVLNTTNKDCNYYYYSNF
uniref:Uncharacterized protein n=1 Tax=Anguilla anguilla TaxID=7936 RepID=A0A0E9UHT2_ANGAN